MARNSAVLSTGVWRPVPSPVTTTASQRDVPMSRSSTNGPARQIGLVFEAHAAQHEGLGRGALGVQPVAEGAVVGDGEMSAHRIELDKTRPEFIGDLESAFVVLQDIDAEHHVRRLRP
jgi:hypothetical protein